MTEPAPEKFPAAYDALLEAIDSDIDGRRLYPNGSVFVNAEQEGAGCAIARAAAEGKPVVLCTQDGGRQLLTPSAPAAA